MESQTLGNLPTHDIKDLFCKANYLWRGIRRLKDHPKSTKERRGVTRKKVTRKKENN